jgi:molybdenum cofactor cytidylyltransferase
MAGHPNKIAVILLAAGSSSRMGEPKQLLKIENDFLIRRSARVALQSNTYEVIVILGHRANEIRKLIEDLPLTILVNDQWEKGIGSSIKRGISYLKGKSFEAGLVMTCDLPLLQPAHLQNLISSYQQNKVSVVASHYSGSLGIPALFDKKLFDQLLLIGDYQGAKQIIQENNKHLISIEFPEGAIDLDTPEDYRAYLKTIDKKKNI